MKKSPLSRYSAVMLFPVLLIAVGCAQEDASDTASTPSTNPVPVAKATETEPEPVREVEPPTVQKDVPVVLTSFKKEAGYGDISGQILYDGDVPEPKLVIKKGDPAVKDSAVCAATDLYGNELIVDPKTKGIANAFVYIYHRNIKKQGIKIHPDLQEIPEDQQEIVFDQKNCRFIPHVMVIRTGQSVRIKSADNCAHNTHTSTLFNDEFNTIIAPNDRKGVLLDNLDLPESLPMPVKCDIHPWMKAHWLIINHPYATVTDKEGRFTIKQLPVGEIEFRIWHERPGYIDRKYVVTVEEGQTKLDPLKVPAEKFE